MPYTHKKVGDKAIKEGFEEPQQLASTVEFWVADKPPKEAPEKEMSDEDKLKYVKQFVYKSDPINFAKQVIGASMSTEPYEVIGFYEKEADALGAVQDVVSANLAKAAALEEKKETVLGELDKHISRLQKEINAHMREAGEMPESADKAHELAENKMKLIKGLREKRKMVEAAKKPIEKLEEGFFDRMTAKLKGVGAQASTTASNFGAFLRGDKDAIQDPKLAKNMAMLKQKASTFKKEIDEMQRDLEKLFSPDVVAKLPADFKGAFNNYVKSLEMIKKYNEGFVTGNLSTGGSKLTSTKNTPTKKQTPVVKMGVA